MRRIKRRRTEDVLTDLSKVRFRRRANVDGLNSTQLNASTVRRLKRGLVVPFQVSHVLVVPYQVLQYIITILISP